MYELELDVVIIKALSSLPKKKYNKYNFDIFCMPQDNSNSTCINLHNIMYNIIGICT